MHETPLGSYGRSSSKNRFSLQLDLTRLIACCCPLLLVWLLWRGQASQLGGIWNHIQLICPILWLTGSPCPGCGMTRSLTALVQGQWLAGIAHHRLGPLVLGLIVLASAWSWNDWIRSRRSLEHAFHRYGLLMVSLLAIALILNRWLGSTN